LLIAPSLCCPPVAGIVVRKILPPPFHPSQAGEGKVALTRRGVLRAALLAVAVDTAVREASAQPKVSKAEAEYQDQPKNGLACAACTLFRPPRSCQVVQGDISPSGWCKFFDLPD
jgi:hypothetical protein